MQFPEAIGRAAGTLPKGPKDDCIYLTYGHGKLRRKKKIDPTPHARSTNNRKEIRVPAPTLKPQMHQRSGHETGQREPQRTQQRNMVGPMLRYQNHGADARAFTEGLYIDALLISYIAYAFIWTIFGRLPYGYSPGLSIWATIPQTMLPHGYYM